MDKEFYTFNVNEHVYVKLTDKGKRIWKDHYTIPFCGCNLSYKEIEEKKNSNGYWKFQLHELMSIFGGKDSGFDISFETNILIRKTELK